jgi:putative hydrolase of the HAD superfamily
MMSEQERSLHPRVIVLDVGNVLVGLDFGRPRQRLQNLFPDEKRLARIQRWLRSVEDPYGLGRMTTEEFVQGAVRELDLERETFIDLWNDIFIDRPYMLPFMQELRAQEYILGICSNTNELHMDYLQRVNPCLAEAQHVIFSYQVGALKPDPTIYHAVEAATGQPGAEHLFLDDLPENVAGARAMGWDAICFETPEQAQAELVARGIQFTPWTL